MTTPRLLNSAERAQDAAAAWLLRQAEGPLDGPEAAAFESWLAADDANLTAYEEALGVWRSIDQISAAPEIIGLRSNALQAFRQAQRRRWSGRLSLKWSGLTAAVSALAFVVVLGYGVRAGGQIYQTGVGERRVVVLEDGSKLSLDADTRVEVHYGARRRDLNLVRGRAKFDVVRDETRPFEVKAADKLVVASGTQFSVELVQQQVRVVLYAGHVAVLKQTGGDGAPAPVQLASRGAPADQQLTPGRELVSDISGGLAGVRAIDPGRSQSWEGGQLVFDNEPLSLAVARVNRYTNDPLEVGDDQAARVRVNGVYTTGNMDAFVEGVTAVAQVRVTVKSGRRIFTK